MTRNREFAFFVILLLCGLGIYSPALNGAFIMDDWGYITQNTLVVDSNSPWVFWSTLKQTDFWPLSYSLYWLFFRCFGQDPFGYHLINLILHAANAFLLYRIFKKYSVSLAVVTAFAFLLHPSHVQAVAWIIQLKTLLSSFFALLSFLVFRKWTEEFKFKFYGLSLGLFTLALLSKSAVVFLPILFLGELKASGKSFTYKLRFVLPFLLLSFASALTTLLVMDLNFLETGAPVFHLSLVAKLLLAAQNLLHYLRVFLWPAGLSYIYPLSLPQVNDVGAWTSLVLVLIGTIALFIYYVSTPKTAKYSDDIAFFAAYLLLLIPALGFFAISNMKLSLVADHWSYFADVFLFFAVIEALCKIHRKFLFLLWPVCAVLAYFSFQQAKTFASELSFWTQVELVNPQNAVGYYNLGTAYQKLELLTDAIGQYQRAEKLDPNHFRAIHNMGTCSFMIGNFQGALEQFKKVTEQQPDFLLGYVGLIKTYRKLGLNSEAELALQKARARNSELYVKLQEALQKP